MRHSETERSVAGRFGEDILLELAEAGEDADEMAELIDRLPLYTAPLPGPEAMQAALNVASRALREAHVRSFREELEEVQTSRTVVNILAAAASDMGLVRWPLWLLSLSIVAVALALTAITRDTHEIKPFLALVPLLGPLGIGLAYLPRDHRVMELEMSCPLNPQALSVARLAMILGSDIVILAAATPLLYWIGFNPSLSALLLSWLTPLLVLSLLSLVAGLWLGSLPAVVTGVSAWGLQLIGGEALGVLYRLRVPADKAEVTNMLGVTLVAVFLLAVVARRAPGRLLSESTGRRAIL